MYVLRSAAWPGTAFRRVGVKRWFGYPFVPYPLQILYPRSCDHTRLPRHTKTWVHYYFLTLKPLVPPHPVLRRSHPPVQAATATLRRCVCVLISTTSTTTDKYLCPKRTSCSRTYLGRDGRPKTRPRSCTLGCTNAMTPCWVTPSWMSMRGRRLSPRISRYRRQPFTHVWCYKPRYKSCLK